MTKTSGVKTFPDAKTLQQFFLLLRTQNFPGQLFLCPSWKLFRAVLIFSITHTKVLGPRKFCHLAVQHFMMEHHKFYLAPRCSKIQSTTLHAVVQSCLVDVNFYLTGSRTNFVVTINNFYRRTMTKTSGGQTLVSGCENSATLS
jgi:hypothetical protein